MKTLHAKGAFIISLALAGVTSIIFILLSAYEFWEGNIGFGISLVIYSILLILIGAFGGIRIYCTHWIKYGNGRVAIRRVSKKCVNGRAVGKWENREDTFLLEEIEAYGLSWRVLGHYVEYHRSSRKSLTAEYFFRLKDGKMIGYEAGYYTRKQDKEFLRYLFEKTGIEFQR